MNVKVGDLEAGASFRTLLTNRRGTVLDKQHTGRDSGVPVVMDRFFMDRFFNAPTEVGLHPNVLVEVEAERRDRP